MAAPVIALAIVSALASATIANQNISKIIVDGLDIEIEGVGVLDLYLPSDMELLLSKMHELCDYYNTCASTTYTPDHVERFLDCCVPCDCSDDCFAKGNCCRDKTGSPRRNKYGEMVTSNGERCTPTNPFENGTHIYHMRVTQCKVGYQGNDSFRCEHPDNDMLDQITPIFSPLTDLEYTNIYCAFCNDEIDADALIPLDMLVLCHQYTPIHRLGNKNFVTENGCQFKAASSMTKVGCFPAMVSGYCDPHRYQRLCDASSRGGPYIDELEIRTCFSCGLPIAEYCFPATHPGFPYEALLNWHMHTSALQQHVPEPDVNHRYADMPPCLDGSFNLTDQQCLCVTCAPSQIHVDVNVDENVCIDAYVTVKGVCLDYALRVTGPMQQLAEDNAISAINHIFSQRDPGISSEIVDFDTDTKTVTYNVRFGQSFPDFADVVTELELFRNTLRTAQPSPGVRIELGSTGVSFTPLPFEHVDFLTYAQNMTTELDFNCEMFVAMSDLQLCQMVMFPPEAYRVRMRDDVVELSGGGGEYRPFEYVMRESRDGELHVQICLNTYLARSNVDARLGSACTAIQIKMVLGLIWFAVMLQFVLTQ